MTIFDDDEREDVDYATRNNNNGGTAVRVQNFRNILTDRNNITIELLI